MPAGYFPSVRPGCGFGPVRPAYWVLIELGSVIVIIGVAVALIASEQRVAQFKTTFAEALLAASHARHEFSERLSLTGSLDPEEDLAGKAASYRASVDPAKSLDAAEQDLRQRGATSISEGGRTRALRFGPSYVVLFRYPQWPGTGAVSFRPAIPDTERPASVMLHCGPGSAPKGWVAPPETIASNLPISHQPWLCRSGRRESN